MQSVRKPVVAGMFYPQEPDELRAEIARYLEKHEPSGPPPFALVVPHAGYAYSGPIAASAYAALKGHYCKTVVLLGPSHRVYFEHVSPGLFDAVETPLGNIEVDKPLGERLMQESGLFSFSEQAHLNEHSLEVQLPFLQTVLEPGFRVLPLVFGALDADAIESAAAALARLYEEAGGELLFVCSTDLSHDYPYNDAVRMDTLVADLLTKMDPDALARVFDTRESEACGAVPLVTLLRLAKRCAKKTLRVTDMRNSGDITGDTYSRIVGYLAAVIA